MSCKATFLPLLRRSRSRPHLLLCLEPPRISTPNETWILSAVFAGFRRVTALSLLYCIYRHTTLREHRSQIGRISCANIEDKDTGTRTFVKVKNIASASCAFGHGWKQRGQSDLAKAAPNDPARVDQLSRVTPRSSVTIGVYSLHLMHSMQPKN